MRVTTQMFWLPKAGNSDEEFEDALWPDEPAESIDLNGFSCAIADGATETLFSKAWANLLTRRWCDENGNLNHFRLALPYLREQWASKIESVAMPWYAEEKARSGAFSSFLGLTLYDKLPDSDSLAWWKVVAVGDSCLFLIRRDCIYPFPIYRAADFNNSPYLLSSISQSVDELEDHLIILHGECLPGDVFYLMTDALACWFLRFTEEDEPANELIADIRAKRDFADFVQKYRNTFDHERRPYLRNDDVTLYRLEIHE